MGAVGDDGQRHPVGQGVERVVGGVRAGVGHRLDDVGRERVAAVEGVQDPGVPGAGAVEADVGEEQRPLLAGLVDPQQLVRVVGRGQVEQHGPAAGRGADEVVGRHGGVVAVGDHAPVALVRDRDRHRGVPVLEPAGPAEVDPLLVLQRAPQEVAVGVVAEGRRQARPQPEAGARHRQVGRPAGARAHPVGPDLLAPGGDAAEPAEDDVEEDHPVQHDVDHGLARVADVRERVEGRAGGTGLASHVSASLSASRR